MVLCSTLAVQKWLPGRTAPVKRAPTVAASGVAAAVAVVPSGPPAGVGAAAVGAGVAVVGAGAAGSEAGGSEGPGGADSSEGSAAADGSVPVTGTAAGTVGVPGTGGATAAEVAGEATAVARGVRLWVPTTTTATVRTESAVVTRVGARSRRRGVRRRCWPMLGRLLPWSAAVRGRSRLWRPELGGS